jgi:hypothetical protein
MLSTHLIPRTPRNLFELLLGGELQEWENLLVFDTKRSGGIRKNLLFCDQRKRSPVFDLAHAIDFFGRENGWFITTKELFEIAVNWKYHAKNTFVFERNMEIPPKNASRILSIQDMFIRCISPNREATRKTLSIRLPLEEKCVLSFFDTTR